MGFAGLAVTALPAPKNTLDRKQVMNSLDNARFEYGPLLNRRGLREFKSKCVPAAGLVTPVIACYSVLLGDGIRN